MIITNSTANETSVISCDFLKDNLGYFITDVPIPEFTHIIKKNIQGQHTFNLENEITDGELFMSLQFIKY